LLQQKQTILKGSPFQIIKLTKERHSKLQAHFQELKRSESLQADVFFEKEKT